jgi:hypothetical protein
MTSTTIGWRLRLRGIAKFLVALSIPVGQTIQAAYTDDMITSNEWTKIAIAAMGAALVWLVPNAQPVTREELKRTTGPTRAARPEDRGPYYP